MDIKCHFIRDVICNGMSNLRHYPSERMSTDGLMKLVVRNSLEKYLSDLELCVHWIRKKICILKRRITNIIEI